MVRSDEPASIRCCWCDRARVVGRQSARPRSKCPDPQPSCRLSISPSGTTVVDDAVGSFETPDGTEEAGIVSATNGRECAPRRRRRHRPDRPMVHPPDPPDPCHPATLPPHLHLHRCRRRRSPPPHCCRNRTRAAHARTRAQSPRHQMPWRRSPDRDAARFVSRGTSQAARAYNDVRSQRCTGATAAKCLATKSTNADFSRTAGGLPSQPACSPPCRSSGERG